MKKLNYLLIVLTLFVSGLFVSCQAVKDLLEITLNDVVFNIDINVTELSAKTSGFTFGGSAAFDPAGNSEIAPYAESIRNVDIKEIKVIVSSITPASGISLLNAAFSITDNINQANFTYEITEETQLAEGTEFILDKSTPNFSAVSEIISALHPASLSLDGEVNQAGFVLGFTYAITADITVGVPNE